MTRLRENWILSFVPFAFVSLLYLFLFVFCFFSKSKKRPQTRLKWPLNRPESNRSESTLFRESSERIILCFSARARDHKREGHERSSERYERGREQIGKSGDFFNKVPSIVARGYSRFEN